MKVIILAGGLGTRISEETNLIPKPMVRIGDMPIIYHIMKYYSSYGFNEFIICCGYRSEVLKNFFLSLNSTQNDLEINFINNEIKFLGTKKNNWIVKLINTGKNTNTGGRVKRIEKFIGGDENFLLTYGDGLSNINLKKLIDSHYKKKKIITVSGINNSSRFGEISIKKNKVKFIEKPKNNSIINGGYFVCNKKVFKFIKNRTTSIFERDTLTKVSIQNQLNIYLHKEFWYCMDNLRDKNYLNNLWNKNNAPWKIWK